MTPQPTEKFINRKFYSDQKAKAEEIEREYIRVDGKLIRRVDYVPEGEPKIIHPIIK